MSHTTLSLGDKLKVLRLLDANTPYKVIIQQFKIAESTIVSIKHNKKHLLALAESNFNPKMKRMRLTDHGQELDKRLLEWFSQKTALGLAVSGPLLKEKALVIANDLNYTTFKASNGWLDSWKRRHCIKARSFQGESRDMDQQIVSSWIASLPHIIAGYEMKDIFNCDETGLFFRSMPDRSLVQKGTACKGGKIQKDRMSILLTCSATGEKLLPMVINKSRMPHCFGGRIPTGVDWYWNDNAWMTTAFFEEYLNKLNRLMINTNRHILLFLDNCRVHASIQLSNIKLQFFPPNTTAGTQPLDAGIIRNFKFHYRKLLLEYLVRHVDGVPEADRGQLRLDNVLKSVNASHAVDWIKRAWATIKPETISNCFAHCGIKSNTDQVVTATAEIDEDEIEFNCLVDELHIDDPVYDEGDGQCFDNYEDEGWEDRVLLGQQPSQKENDNDNDVVEINRSSADISCCT